jgi:heme-degrading monooxygenase HmoA
MYARLNTLTGVQDIDAAVAFLQEAALSVTQQQRGYGGLSAAADRESGLLAILTLWETAADREASNSALSKIREEARSQLASGLTVELFEQRVAQIGQAPTVGNSVLATRISMDPSRINDNVEYFKSEVLPQIAAAPGFRSIRNLINAETGEGVVGSIWENEQSLKAAQQAAQNRRSEAASRGVSFGDSIVGELVFIDRK